MEVFKFNILPMEETEKREAFKEAVNNCPICCKRMEFKYEADFLSNTILEDAHCPECQLQIRTETHSVQ